ncbi:MAG: hypothetical protein D6805_04215 [Planctomycetota bacterium]|nr:MAG: hypothetical protein D6805_04215 [Planctomycetota bacterium]
MKRNFSFSEEFGPKTQFIFSEICTFSFSQKGAYFRSQKKISSKANKDSFALKFAFLLIKFFFAVLKCLPLRLSWELACGLGTVFYHCSKRSYRIGMQNLDYVYGKSISLPRKRKILLRSFQSLAMTFVELFVLPAQIYSQRKKAKNFIILQGLRHLENALSRQKGVIIVSPHLGAWEAAGILSSFSSYPFHSIAKPLHNIRLSQWIAEQRISTGACLIDRKGAMKICQYLLAQNKLIVILADQRVPYRQRMQVRFLGRAAMLTKSVALLSLQTGAPILPGYCYRDRKRQRYVFVYDRPIYPDRKGRRRNREEVFRLTQAWANQLSKFIVAQPELYLWSHRLFRDFISY